MTKETKKSNKELALEVLEAMEKISTTIQRDIGMTQLTVIIGKSLIGECGEAELNFKFKFGVERIVQEFRKAANAIEEAYNRPVPEKPKKK